MTSGPGATTRRQPSWEHPARIGEYVVEEYLGGGMCHVYRARDPLIDKTVAVKILKPENNSDPESRERFLREARVAAKMDHPNIVSVHRFVEDEAQPYMVMEFLKGDDLRAIIKERRTGTVENKLQIALQIADAMQYIHAKDIFYRDVKPENIRINQLGVVKVMDFGIAKSEDLNITQPGFTMGTVYYMSPEQIRGEEVTRLSDVYSYGILLFELFVGFRPVNGETHEQVFYRILQEPIDLKPLEQAAVPESIIKLISACTAKVPSQRPRGFSEVCSGLKQEIEATEATKKEALPVVPPPRPSYRMIVSAAVILVAVVSIIAGIVAFQPDDPIVLPEQPVADATPPPVLATTTGEMVLIPAGMFLSGEGKNQEVLPSFYIDRTEVTNEAYGAYCAATGKALPPDFAAAPKDFPVVNITIDDARDFARWAGKRLPTLKEWEKAARGTEGWAYPWGNDADSSRANVARTADTPTSLASVTAFPAVGRWGIHQMVGNVWEFADELTTPSPQAITVFQDFLNPPPGKDESWYLMMGGSYDELLPANAAYDTSFVPARFRSPHIGFRCVMPPPK